jgi:hypothetical protein
MALGAGVEPVWRAAAAALATLGAIELERGLWANLVEGLAMITVSAETNPITRQAAMLAMDMLCYEVVRACAVPLPPPLGLLPHRVFARAQTKSEYLPVEDLVLMFNAITINMQEGGDPECRRIATRALDSALDFARCALRLQRRPPPPPVLLPTNVCRHVQEATGQQAGVHGPHCGGGAGVRQVHRAPHRHRR